MGVIEDDKEISAEISKFVKTSNFEKEHSVEVQLPAEYADLNGALAFGAPWALGREIVFVEETETDGKKQFSITVDLGKPFDSARFDRQAGFINELSQKIF